MVSRRDKTTRVEITSKAKENEREIDRTIGWNDERRIRELIGSMLLMVEFCICGDIDAIKFVFWMKCTYMRPHVGTLTKMILAVRTLKSPRCPAFVLIMSYHVTSMFVGTRTIRARMSISFVELSRSPLYHAPSTSVGICKRGQIFQRLVAKDRRTITSNTRYTADDGLGIETRRNRIL